MILDRINTPFDLRKLSVEELPSLCDELRSYLQSTTDEKEGHIRSSLGVTELTVALHYSLNTPKDILIWDVGHQAYIHKIITGRKQAFNTNRQKDGLAGFTSRQEGDYDPFGAGHSSTSISAAAGFALADKLRKNVDRNVVAVIGDGAITGGMSFEALNYLGEAKLNVLVILNDNKSSIDQNRGALAEQNNYRSYCDSLGIDFLGECDGHDMTHLVEVLNDAKQQKGPRLLKVNTIKGKGRNPSSTTTPAPPGFQQVFAQSLLDLMRKNEKVVVISPAMLSGGGLSALASEYPDRCIDVGIAEQHAVTLAAGLAADGMVPVVHLYSTFAQRAYDQIIHDVALQNLHVIFAIDRAGLVGRDGNTHHGVFDPGFFNTIPNLQICSPVNSTLLSDALQSAVDGSLPTIIRFPKNQLNPVLEQIGMEDMGEGVNALSPIGGDIAVISFGIIAANVQEAITGLSVTHYNLNKLKPFPQKAIRDLAKSHRVFVTVEENSARGGLADSLRAFFSESRIETRVLSLSLPDSFVGHASRSELLKDLDLDPLSIRKALVSAIDQ